MMDSDTQYRYEFPPGLPLRGVGPGTNLLVSGPSGSGARDIALDLVTPATGQEASLLVSADIEAGSLLDRLDETPGPIDRSMLGIVDCAGPATDRDPRFSPHTEPISDPGDLTAIEIEFSLLYEKLAQREPTGIRIGLFSLSSMLAHAQLRDVSRFVHMLTGRIIATDDLGVFVVDSTAQDARTVDAMSQFCDGHVEVREGEDGLDIRVAGLDDHPAEWAPVDYDVRTEAWDEASAEVE